LTKIIKRRGYKEPFKPKKIRRSIKKAVIDAGYTLEEKDELIDEISDIIMEKVKKKSEIDTDTIRDSILNQLDKFEPDIYKSWIKFDKKYKS
jgi:transcriptional regulator NrdR family protein